MTGTHRGTPRGTDVSRLMQAAEAASPVDALESVSRELGLAFGAVAVSFLITDLSGRSLVRLAHVPLAAGPRRRGQRPRPPGTPRGRGVGDGPALRRGPGGAGAADPGGAGVATRDRRGHRPRRPVAGAGPGDGARRVHRPAGALPAGRARRATWWRRSARSPTCSPSWSSPTASTRTCSSGGNAAATFSLSAEIQQRLLPQSRTCEAAAFTLAGWLEPAASIGGDTFDYSLARDVLHLSLTDAMGHGVEAALTASVCLGGLRGARRRGGSLLDQATATNARCTSTRSATATTSPPGCSGASTCAPARSTLVNAGHVAPYLLRGTDLGPGPARRPAPGHVPRRGLRQHPDRPRPR